jgi:hypothetical protein
MSNTLKTISEYDIHTTQENVTVPGYHWVGGGGGWIDMNND